MVDKKTIALGICIAIALGTLIFAYQQEIDMKQQENHWQQRLDKMSLDVKVQEQLADKAVRLMADVETERVNAEARIEVLQKKMEILNNSLILEQKKKANIQENFQNLRSEADATVQDISTK